MASMYSTAKAYSQYILNDLADARTNDWFLVDGAMPLVTMEVLYLAFVLKIGPSFMKNRKPFQLKTTIVWYNIFQVLVSTWMFYESLDAAWLNGGYSLKCQPVDRSRSPQAMRIARGVYVFYLAKVSELMDTVFFVLRKKDNQVSFLHLYHHTLMLFVGWIGVKYVPGGHLMFIGLINSFVHMIMYTYYMISILGPQYQKYLWWKKYITILQLVQFLLIFLHASQLVWTDCGYPRGLAVIAIPNALIFYNMFSNFYKKEYLKKKSNGQSKTKTN